MISKRDKMFEDDTTHSTRTYGLTKITTATLEVKPQTDTITITNNKVIHWFMELDNQGQDEWLEDVVEKSPVSVKSYSLDIREYILEITYNYYEKGLGY